MENLKKYLNQWVKINFNNALYENKFHPEDLIIAQNVKLFTSWFVKCVAVDEIYITIDYLGSILRVNPFGCIGVYPTSKFQKDEFVKYANGKGEIKQGNIYGIDWHNRDNKHIYYILENGKMKTRRYFDEDLEKVEI